MGKNLFPFFEKIIKRVCDRDFLIFDGTIIKKANYKKCFQPSIILKSFIGQLFKLTA